MKHKMIILSAFLLALAGCTANSETPSADLDCTVNSDCLRCGSSCISADIAPYVKCAQPSEDIVCVCSQGKCTDEQ